MKKHTFLVIVYIAYSVFRLKAVKDIIFDINAVVNALDHHVDAALTTVVISKEVQPLKYASVGPAADK